MSRTILQCYINVVFRKLFLITLIVYTEEADASMLSLLPFHSPWETCPRLNGKFALHSKCIRYLSEQTPLCSLSCAMSNELDSYKMPPLLVNLPHLSVLIYSPAEVLCQQCRLAIFSKITSCQITALHI